MTERDRKSSWPPFVQKAMSEGAKKYRYRGLRCLKKPTEMALYTMLLDRERPKTIFELGTKEGGSALWLADVLRALGQDGHVISVDIRKPNPWYLGQRSDIRLFQGDTLNLSACLTPEILDFCPHPWLVIEDASHESSHVLASLRFFDKKMLPGEFIVVEDAVISDLGREAEFNGGPNAAIFQFLSETSGRFSINTYYCDFYGHNGTGNPNGYLQCISQTPKV